MLALTGLIVALTHLNDGDHLTSEEMDAIAGSQATIEAARQGYLQRVATEEAEERKRAISGTSWRGLLLRAVEQLLNLRFRQKIKLTKDAIRAVHLLSILDETASPYVVGFLKVNGAITEEVAEKVKHQLANNDTLAIFFMRKGVSSPFGPTRCFEVDSSKLEELCRNIVAGNVPELEPVDGANGPTLSPIMTEDVIEPPERPYSVG